jgi:hypothetical protein
MKLLQRLPWVRPVVVIIEKQCAPNSLLNWSVNLSMIELKTISLWTNVLLLNDEIKLCKMKKLLGLVWQKNNGPKKIGFCLRGAWFGCWLRWEKNMEKLKAFLTCSTPLSWENGGMTSMLENLQLLSSDHAKAIHVSKRKFKLLCT